MNNRGKLTRGRRTPKRFKNGASVHNTPKRGDWDVSANTDRETEVTSSISEATKKMSLKNKTDYLATRMDDISNAVSLLVTTISDKLNNSNILSRGEGEEDESIGSHLRVGEGSDDRNLSDLLLNTDKRNYSHVVSEIDVVKSEMNEIKQLLEKVASKIGSKKVVGAEGREGSANVGGVEAIMGRFTNYEKKLSDIANQIQNDKDELINVMNNNKSEILQALKGRDDITQNPNHHSTTRQPEPQQLIAPNNNDGRPNQTSGSERGISNLPMTSSNTGTENTGNYSEVFLDKLREYRSYNIILFNLEETNEEGINEIAQKHIDEHEVGIILDYIQDQGMNLRSNVVEMTRLGWKSEGKIRPLKVRFESQYHREVAVWNGFRIKYINDYEHLKKVKISRDLIRDDRDKAKIEYEKKKQAKLFTNNGNRPAVENPDQSTPIMEGNGSQGTTGGAPAPPRQENQTSVT